MVMITRQPNAFIRRHATSVLSIVIASISALVFLYIVNVQADTNIATLEQSSQAESAKIDAAITKINLKKAADAKLAAEQKAAAEAAAASAQAQSTTAINPVHAASCNTSTSHNVASGHDVVVNKKHCIKPLNYTPGDLVTVYDATLTATAAAQFEAMYLAAASAGLSLRVTSSFRSYDNQVATYAHWVAVNGQAGADTVSARPGYSEHQTGLALDLAAGGCSLECFAGTAQYIWLQTNAASYGFVERYPAGLTHITGYSPEAWHYRYVGTTIAGDMKARGISTLEQYWNISGGDYAG